LECRIDFCDPRAIILLRLDQPLRIFEQDVDTGWKAIHSRGANASLGIEGFVKLEIEHGLLDATGKHIPSETDHLLCPGEDVDGIVELRAQTLVSENVELAEPRVVDEAGVTQPIY